MRKVSTHSRLKAAGKAYNAAAKTDDVSTHSRLKAAGWMLGWNLLALKCFNTQPPEGGWNLVRLAN